MRYSLKEEMKIMETILDPEMMVYPLNFVRFAFPWGEEGTPLANRKGPRKWQEEELINIGKHNLENQYRINRGEDPIPYDLAISSGRGTGKSCFFAWLTLWAMSTQIGCTVIITANTEQQLRSRTWAELGKWHTMLRFNSHWFERTATTLKPAKWLDTALRQKSQRDTAYYYAQAQLWSEENPDAFAGVHNENGVMLLFDEGCHDDQTEVLTENGWRLFKDVTRFDRLLTKDPETDIAEYSEPTKLISFPRQGKMHLYEKRGGNFCVTPNHRMFYRSLNHKSETRKGKWKFGEIQDMSKSQHHINHVIKWDKEDEDYFILPALTTARKTFPDRYFHLDDALELLGYYFSEGHLQKGTRRAGGSKLVYGFGLSQQKGEVFDKMVAVLDRLKLKYSVYSHYRRSEQIYVYDMQIGRWLAQFGHYCLSKTIPRFIQELSVRQIRIFLKAFLDGDGYIHKGTSIYYTSSKDMADDLQELILRTGKHCTLKVRKLKGKKINFGTHTAASTCDGYVVSENYGSDEFSFLTKNQKLIDYDGMVYCAEIPPHHLLFTRRNGYCMWSGNSNIPASIWTVSEGFFTEPIFLRFWLVVSNPRRPQGAFFDCFHKDKEFWNTRFIDSRDVEGSDKSIYDKIIKKHGEDSDVARVEVKGQFPRTGSNQLIGYATTEAAAARSIKMEDVAGSAKILGLDVARYGDDLSVLMKRQGLFLHMPMDFAKMDNMTLAGVVANVANEWGADAIMIGSGGGQGVIDRLRQLGFNVLEVDEGGSADRKDLYLNKRIEMWDKVDEWLLAGGVIPNHERLKEDLSAPMYAYTPTSNKKILEAVEAMKKRGLPSPDFATALALTFGYDVAPTMGIRSAGTAKVVNTFDPFSLPASK